MAHRAKRSSFFWSLLKFGSVQPCFAPQRRAGAGCSGPRCCCLPRRRETRAEGLRFRTTRWRRRLPSWALARRVSLSLRPPADRRPARAVRRSTRCQPRSPKARRTGRAQWRVRSASAPRRSSMDAGMPPKSLAPRPRLRSCSPTAGPASRSRASRRTRCNGLFDASDRPQLRASAPPLFPASRGSAPKMDPRPARAPTVTQGAHGIPMVRVSTLHVAPPPSLCVRCRWKCCP